VGKVQGAVLDSFGDYFVKVILVVALALTLGAIVGLDALQSGRYGPLGTASSSSTFLGYSLIVIETIVTVLTGSESLYSVRLIGGAAVLIDSILVGAMTLLTWVPPWWCGVLIIVGFPLVISRTRLAARGAR
jgi:hypothetical protein